MARPLSKSMLLLTRTLHIYATMFSLLLLVFFAVTGFVMNHTAWFNTENPIRIIEREAALPPELAGAAGPDHKLAVVEYLRARLGARGEMSSYDDQDDPVRIQFTGPGRKIDFALSKAADTLQVREELRNRLAFLTDLHKGTGTGELWRRVIDAASIFLFFASLTGLILWMSLSKRRAIGIVCLIAGIGACLAVVLLMP
jgi:hypothetical protein